MNKEQFMEFLDYYFGNVDETTYKEIKDNYKEHFRIGIENGKTEEETSIGLDSSREILNECKEVGIIRENNFFGVFNLDSIGDFFNSKISDQSKDKDYDLSQQILEFNNDFYRIGVKSNADIDVSTHELDKIIVTYTATDESQKLDVNYMNYALKLGKTKMEKFFQKGFIKSISIRIPQNGDLGLDTATASEGIYVDVTSNDTTCNASSSDVDITTQSNNVNVNTASGDVQVPKCKKEVHVDTVSGDVKIVSENPEVTVDTVSGDIKIDADENKDLNARGVSNDININIEGKKGSIELRTVSGEIKISSYYKGSSKRISKPHNQSFTNDDIKISAATVSGNIIID